MARDQTASAAESLASVTTAKSMSAGGHKEIALKVAKSARKQHRHRFLRLQCPPLMLTHPACLPSFHSPLRSASATSRNASNALPLAASSTATTSTSGAEEGGGKLLFVAEGGLRQGARASGSTAYIAGLAACRAAGAACVRRPLHKQQHRQATAVSRAGRSLRAADSEVAGQ